MAGTMRVPGAGGRGIAVDGLRETVSGLKEFNNKAPYEVQKTLRKRTKDIIVPAAQDEWKSQRIKPSVAERAVQPAAGQSWAGIRIRYKDETFPYAGGIVFGALKYKQFRPWKGNQYTGNKTFDDYVVGPAFLREGDKFADGMMLDLENAVWRAIK